MAKLSAAKKIEQMTVTGDWPPRVFPKTERYRGKRAIGLPSVEEWLAFWAVHYERRWVLQGNKYFPVERRKPAPEKAEQADR